MRDLHGGGKGDENEHSEVTVADHWHGLALGAPGGVRNPYSFHAHGTNKLACGDGTYGVGYPHASNTHGHPTNTHSHTVSCGPGLGGAGPKRRLHRCG